jgi:predicted TIM-barrel fold metal-dependent hydrolase
VRVDVHSHYLPPRYFDEMARLGALDRVESFSVYGPMLGKAAVAQFAAGEQSFVDGLLAQMDRCHVDLAVLSIGAVQPYFPDEQTAARAVRYANGMLADAVAMGAGRLAAFGSVPLPHAAAAVHELAYCLDEYGFAGINVGCSADGRPLDDPALIDFWAAADKRAAAVFLHPGSTPKMAVGSADFHLAPDFCSPTEMAVALCRLIVSGITTRYARIDYIAGATGGTLPYLARRFDRGLRQSHPELYEELGGVIIQLQQLWYDTSMIEDQQVFDVVRASVGVDRLVLGSDIPRGPLADAVGFIADSDRLSPAEKVRILDCNAMELLRLGQADDPDPAPGALPAQSPVR